MNVPIRNQNLNFYAVRKLNDLAIFHPTSKQIETMKSILTQSGIIVSETLFPPALSNQETTCLLLAIQGKHITEIAKALNVSESSVQTYKQRIREKLKCHTNEQAVYECFRYNYIAPI